ncbi:KRI1-like family C-terminal-domain-containing protein [Naematelia encephala]|uniref:KRI1-like family C-terminal-domain-containing protein n=1 Tax=Naematelia encephala TaxID=71784 RepID=A0A1Y2BIN9_9TREE|nr:KRI1-like family C-terminal-domain-containing protein [Naematelia encephala]
MSKRPINPELISEDESDYTSSSESGTEDEEGAELTPALDAAILRTLAKIKNGQGVYGDERILESELKAAEERAKSLGLKKVSGDKTRDKPYLLSDHHRRALLEGRDQTYEPLEEGVPLTNVQSERLLRQEAVSAFKTLAESDEDEDEDFDLKPRVKDEEDEEIEAEEYRRFLLEMGGGEEEVRKVLGLGEQSTSNVREAEPADTESGEEDAVQEVKKEQKQKDNKSGLRKEIKAKADDDFLMNYILNRGWIDRSESHVPTYKEIVGDEVENEAKNEQAAAGPSNHPWGVLEEDDFDEKAEEFETQYNFRFEEPGSSTIPAHPREIPSLVRRADDTRKIKRAARAERKAAERAAEEEKTRRLKGSKRREMEKQLKSLKAELGEGLDWAEVEKVLEGDFDEAQWEKVIGTMLSKAADVQEYGDDDEGKPEWDDIEDAEYDEEDLGEEPYPEEGENADDGPINMDADFVEEEPVKKKRRKDKKGKHRSKDEDEEEDADLTVAERAEKVKQAMEEYKSLDHEDKIGDLATRFKYTQTAPASFGLTPAEILLATDAELNAIATVKHLATYRHGGIGMAGKGLGKRVRELKAQLQARRWGEEQPQYSHRHEGPSGANALAVNGVQRKGKRKGKKERMKEKIATGLDEVINHVEGQKHSEGGGGSQVSVGEKQPSESNGNGDEADGEGKKKRKKKKKGDKAGGDGLLQIFE